MVLRKKYPLDFLILVETFRAGLGSDNRALSVQHNVTTHAPAPHPSYFVFRVFTPANYPIRNPQRSEWGQDLGYAVGEWVIETQQPKPPKKEQNYKAFVGTFFI